jgi:hypothetical protein
VKLSVASDVLYRAGARIMRLDDVTTIGVWSDLDGPEVRCATSCGELKVNQSRGPCLGSRQHLAEPWSVRDRLLNDMDGA